MRDALKPVIDWLADHPKTAAAIHAAAAAAWTGTLGAWLSGGSAKVALATGAAAAIHAVIPPGMGAR